jgi:hypothetical protein
MWKAMLTCDNTRRAIKAIAMKTVKIMSERKVIGIGAIVDKNMDTLDDVYYS